MTSFENTLAIVLASTIARLECETDATRKHRYRCFRFKLLAAAFNDNISLPKAGWTDVNHSFHISYSTAGEHLHLQIQALGYQTLKMVSLKQATLQSADGLINESFGFDARGYGVLVFADISSVRDSIADFAIHIEDKNER